MQSRTIALALWLPGLILPITGCGTTSPHTMQDVLYRGTRLTASDASRLEAEVRQASEDSVQPRLLLLGYYFERSIRQESDSTEAKATAEVKAGHILWFIRNRPGCELFRERVFLIIWDRKIADELEDELTTVVFARPSDAVVAANAARFSRANGSVSTAERMYLEAIARSPEDAELRAEAREYGVLGGFVDEPPQ